MPMSECYSDPDVFERAWEAYVQWGKRFGDGQMPYPSYDPVVRDGILELRNINGLLAKFKVYPKGYIQRLWPK